MKVLVLNREPKDILANQMLQALSRILSSPSSSVHSSGPIDPATSLYKKANDNDLSVIDRLITQVLYLIRKEYNRSSGFLNFLVSEQLVKFFLRNTHT